MKAITNQAKTDELKGKINAAVVDPPIVTPTNDPEKIVLDIKDVLTRDPEQVTEEEQNFIEAHKEELTDEQKLAFHIIEELPVKPVVAAPAKEMNIDYKARYAGSTQEAQVLAARNKEFLEAREKAKTLPLPTDEEMKTEYIEEWDEMTDRQKKNAKLAKLNENQNKILDEVTEKMKKRDQWVEDTKKYSVDPSTLVKYPLLAGHEEEFVQFCSLPTRVGINYDDLVKAFSFDLKPVVVTPKRANLLEPAGGGGSVAPVKKELTVEEIGFLRAHNPKEYKRLIQAKKINIDL